MANGGKHLATGVALSVSTKTEPGKPFPPVSSVDAKLNLLVGLVVSIFSF